MSKDLSQIKIRALRADEIEIRVAQVMQKGVQLLLYKDSRCDKRILDEIFGIDGWANCYSEIKGNLYCSIMIYDDKTGMWIQKQDCGVESNTEKEKGEASDAFKRACFNIGIGRELYTKIFIFVPTETIESGKDKYGNSTYKLKDKYQKWYVSNIKTDEETEKIVFLEISEEKTNKVVFTYKAKEIKTNKVLKENKSEIDNKTVSLIITPEERKKLFELANDNSDIVKNAIQLFGYNDTTKIKKEDYEKICNEIQDTLLK